MFLDYSGAKYTRFPPKIAAAQKALFGWLKTANISIVCGTVTLKSLLPQAFSVSNVHPRPRKRPPRCTLDCGFKTSESPALRGFVAERAPIRGTSLYLVLKSNGLRHPKNLPVKFSFSSKTVPVNIAKKLPSQRCFKPLLTAFSTSRTNSPRSLSWIKMGTHSAFGERSHTAAHTAKQGAFQMGVVSLPSERSARFGNPAWPGVLQKNAESLRDSDALMRVAVPRRRGPAGLRDPVSALLIMW